VSDEMNIEHVAIWVNDLEKMKTFYETVFKGQSSEKYHNEKKQFESYFIRFENGARLEVMRRSDVHHQKRADMVGWAHIAFSLGSKEAVDELTKQLSTTGYPVLSGPRVTRDGYYECLIEDPEGNHLELTV
jgi:lactoylglutathione lyase